MTEIELEYTYLARKIPANLKDYPSKLIADVFYPTDARHPILRVRQNGDKYQVTKKMIAEGTDASRMIEETIHLTAEEYKGLTAGHGKRFTKRRYQYPYQGHTAEIDVYQNELKGLVVIDFEFTNRQDQQAFTMPDFCLADITQEEQFAADMLAGKSYADIAPALQTLGYKALSME